MNLKLKKEKENRKDQSKMLQQHKGRAERFRLASISFLEYHGSKPSRASVVGKALGGNGVESRVRQRAQGHGEGGGRTHPHTRSLTRTRLDHHIGYLPMLYHFFFFFVQLH